MLVSSIFLWAFLGASFALCTAFLQEYEVNHQVGRVVLGGSILGSIVISTALTLTARRFAAPRILTGMAAGGYSDQRIGRIFERLSAMMGIARVELREAKVGNAFSVVANGRKVVAVSPSLVSSLSDEETEAVLAHELSHFKNRDSLAKGLARLARVAFSFDPVIRLVEAAIHRELELLADRSSVKYTGKPLALASALIKVHSVPSPSLRGLGAGLFVGSGRRKWLSLYPDLQRRIAMLLRLANRAGPFEEAKVTA